MKIVEMNELLYYNFVHAAEHRMIEKQFLSNLGVGKGVSTIWTALLLEPLSLGGLFLLLFAAGSLRRESFIDYRRQSKRPTNRRSNSVEMINKSHSFV